jgi:hypothetical protein
MSQRRILVIGSQCAQLNTLSFLPQVAQDLYSVMLDPELGGCVPALEASGPLLDPSVQQAHNAIEGAFQQASKDGATLFLAFIGHGEVVDEDFYLLPFDASVPPNSRGAIHLVQLITELHRRHSDVDGLVALLDCCYSGVAAAGAAARWVSALHGTLRFEVLTAAADRPAADGCFTRSLVDLIRTGLVSVPLEYLRCEHIRDLLKGRCPKQIPQLPSYNADEGLYLARNAVWAVRKKRWSGAIAETVEHLTAWFQPTPQLAEVVAATTDERCVFLTGLAGAGKSALAAALVSPEVTEGVVPAGFIQAAAFITSAASSDEIASQLAEQLKSTVQPFAAAQLHFRQKSPLEEWRQLDSWQREVLGPLRMLRLDRSLRIVIDGLDQLSKGANVAVYQALSVLATDPAYQEVRLLVTARSDTPPPAQSKTLLLGRADDDTIRCYLERRQIPSNTHQAIVSRAQGSWLVSRLLADQVSVNPDRDPQDLPPDLVGIYDQALRQVGASESQRWRAELRPVLGVLAAAGIGPILPMPLLCAASSKLGGPGRPTGVRDILVDLRGLVIRVSSGTEKEQVGLFHQTFAEYLLDPEVAFSIDPVEPHGALAEAIGELAPMDKHDPSNALHRYAAMREPDHLWKIDRYIAVINALLFRAAIVPAENLARWRSWYDRIAEKLGKDHIETLNTLNNIAYWTGGTGDWREALRLLEELLPDQERVLGEDHPNTLTLRNNIAHWTGQTGDSHGALRLFKELLPDQEQVLGKENLHTLRTRNSIAGWTGKAGDVRGALRLHEEVLLDMKRVLGENCPDTLNTRGVIADSKGQTGEAREALRLFKELLPDVERVQGKDHPDALGTRLNIAHWTGQTGDEQTALRLNKELLPNVERLLGKDHPDTLTVRSNIAHWTGKAGDSHGALRLNEELLPDRERVLGRDHPDTLTTRNNIAEWTGWSGKAREALQLNEELLPDRERLLGKDHPDTLITRNNIAGWTGHTGDAPGALRLYKELLPDQERVLGDDHPDTLRTRSNIADYTGLTGDARGALRLNRELLPDQERVLGDDHLDTLRMRNNIAQWAVRTGEVREALQLFKELLPDLERVLGEDHPVTLKTRKETEHWQKHLAGE